MAEESDPVSIPVGLYRMRNPSGTLGSVSLPDSIGGQHPDPHLSIGLMPFEVAELLSKGKVSVQIRLNRIGAEERRAAAQRLVDSLEHIEWARDSVAETMFDLLNGESENG